MSILITGGTGSLGRAIIKKLLSTPEYYGKIMIYSRDEHKQENMQKEFKELDVGNKLRFFIGDVRDEDRLRLAVQQATYIIHAAALKIVPAAEYNPFEYVKTNIVGSQNLINCCLSEYRTSLQPTIRVLAVSTDKAVNPRNLYGATKLCMERMMLAANNIKGEQGPKFSIARYGNVSNSSGSVIPLFAEQKRKGEPLTVTDENMTRFWIELDEAADFVLSRLFTMQGREIFIPKMPSFKIRDLVDAFGCTYKVTGIREGEKLHEQIDETTFSNKNVKFLSPEEIANRLKAIGAM